MIQIATLESDKSIHTVEPYGILSNVQIATHDARYHTPTIRIVEWLILIWLEANKRRMDYAIPPIGTRHRYKIAPRIGLASPQTSAR